LVEPAGCGIDDAFDPEDQSMRLTSLAICGLSAVAWLAGPLPAHAQNAPQQLLGKSLVVNWTEHRLQRREGRGEFRPRSIPQLLQIYISTEGRIFERRTATSHRGSGSRESVGAGAMGRQADTSFQGRSLAVLAGTRGGGARAIMIEFDEGNAVEFKPQGTSGESCAIRDGNVFSQ
jgi:hypothetical protein